ncbi:MAG: hypothetical protein J6J76_02660 [Paraprevotella sp.]|nr:hypothetical protein [Paraprevotella sp.]
MEKKDKKESVKKQKGLTEEERKKFFELYEKSMAYGGEIEEPKTLIQKIKDWIG